VLCSIHRVFYVDVVLDMLCNTFSVAYVCMSEAVQVSTKMLVLVLYALVTEMQICAVLLMYIW
jgi:hypothetical protein